MRQGCLLMSHLAWALKTQVTRRRWIFPTVAMKDNVFNRMHAHEKGQKISVAVAFVYAQLEHRSRKHTSQKKRVENTEN